jgi:hypothetical protein
MVTSAEDGERHSASLRRFTYEPRFLVSCDKDPLEILELIRSRGHVKLYLPARTSASPTHFYTI